MRKDYDSIKQKFELFFDLWKTGKTEEVESLVTKEVHAYFSTVHNKEGNMHTVFGVKTFLMTIPATENMDYEICNYICRINGDKAQQAAEVAVCAYNSAEEYFKYVATFSNSWIKVNDNWVMEEIRVDIKDYPSPLRDYFAEKWHFENELASLTATVHLPCIFPDIDTPYFRIKEAEDVLTEEEKAIECFSKFNYGIDWIIFTYCRDTMDENFENDTRVHFVQKTKFARQRFRYWCSPYKVENVEVNGDKARLTVNSMIDNCLIREVNLVKRGTEWRILNYKEAIN